MAGLMERNRERLSRDLDNAEKRKYFSPSTYGDFNITVPVIREYAYGKLIDIGCGNMPFRDFLPDKVAEYDTFDAEKRVDGVKYIGDVQDMSAIKDESYDSAMCLEVLEHVRDPFRAVREINRIMKKGGTLIVTVPHLSRLHEEPNDFYRYTKYGLEHILKTGGFEVIELKPRGGLFSFLGHQFSTVFVCLFWHIPVVRKIVFFINKWCCVKVCVFLDKILDKKKIFALGYTCVAKKL